MQQMPESLQNLLKTARQKHLPKDQIVSYAGDYPHDVFILGDGIVKVHDINEQGNDKILHLLKAPALLPFAFFSNSSVPTQWFYTALTDCDVWTLPAKELRAAMAKDFALTQFLTEWFSQEVHEMLVRISSLGKTTAHDKIKSALTFLAVHHAHQRRSGWRRVLFPVSHQMLADMSGITRERAAIVMKELQDFGVVRNPRLTILEINFEKLIANSA